MAAAVRYFSRHGNTRSIAEAIADGANVPVISIKDESELMNRVDV